MAENKKTNPLWFDKRVMHRFVQNKKLSPKDAEKYLANLPDTSAQGEDIVPKIYGDKKGHTA